MDEFARHRGGMPSADWDPLEHPRDYRGRFIETGSKVQVSGGIRGEVTEIIPDRENGLTRLRVRTSDGREGTVPADRVIVTDADKNDLPGNGRNRDRHPVRNAIRDADREYRKWRRRNDDDESGEPNSKDFPFIPQGKDPLPRDPAGDDARYGPRGDIDGGSTPGATVADPLVLGDNVRAPSGYQGKITKIVSNTAVVRNSETGKLHSIQLEKLIRSPGGDSDPLPGDVNPRRYTPETPNPDPKPVGPRTYGQRIAEEVKWVLKDKNVPEIEQVPQSGRAGGLRTSRDGADVFVDKNGNIVMRYRRAGDIDIDEAGRGQIVQSPYAGREQNNIRYMLEQEGYETRDPTSSERRDLAPNDFIIVGKRGEENTDGALPNGEEIATPNPPDVVNPDEEISAPNAPDATSTSGLSDFDWAALDPDWLGDANEVKQYFEDSSLQARYQAQGEPDPKLQTKWVIAAQQLDTWAQMAPNDEDFPSPYQMSQLGREDGDETWPGKQLMENSTSQADNSSGLNDVPESILMAQNRDEAREALADELDNLAEDGAPTDLSRSIARMLATNVRNNGIRGVSAIPRERLSESIDDPGIADRISTLIQAASAKDRDDDKSRTAAAGDPPEAQMDDVLMPEILDPELDLPAETIPEEPETPEYDRSPAVAGVVLFAQDTGRLLMLQRGIDDPEDPAAGMWEFPGGHLEDDDKTALDGAKREWAEEVGQKFPSDHPPVHTWITPDGVYQGFMIPVESEKDVDLDSKRKVQNPDADYSEQCAWFPIEHAAINPGLRKECRDMPWDRIEQLLPVGRFVANELLAGLVAATGKIAEKPQEKAEEHVIPSSQGYEFEVDGKKYTTTYAGDFFDEDGNAIGFTEGVALLNRSIDEEDEEPA